VRHGQLLLGEAAVFIKDTAGTPLICVFALVILLFPDGRLTRRWAWVLWCYLAAFAAALKDAVDLDAIRDDLANAVHQALEPAHVSVWINERH